MENFEEKNRDIINRLRQFELYYPFVSRDEQMERIAESMVGMASSDLSLLITGDTGTGKDAVARAIHKLSERANSGFIRINCGAIPDGLVESELFGHEKGAFTGASFQKPGKFEMAKEGTILLDEICEMKPDLQIRLLNVLDRYPYFRVGGKEPVTLMARVMSTTNKDIARDIARGRFRHDLYQRLNGARIHIPPLKNRPADIGIIANAMLKDIGRQHGMVLSLMPDALQKMQKHDWPGNIRELKFTLERVIIIMLGMELSSRQAIPASVIDRAIDRSIRDIAESMVSDTIERMPTAVAEQDGDNGKSKKSLIEEMERDMLLEALETARWNQKAAGKILGISGRQVNYRVKHYNITHPSWRKNR